MKDITHGTAFLRKPIKSSLMLTGVGFKVANHLLYCQESLLPIPLIIVTMLLQMKTLKNNAEMLWIW